MSPSVAIKSLTKLGVYNLIITSGTLSPLESFECEMGIPFNVKLQNTHVISHRQLSIQFMFKDPNGEDLSGSFDNRNNPKYYNGLGLTILELSRTIPKGMFIFFSSYSLINKCIEIWKQKHGFNLWESISQMKRIFVEPRTKNEFAESIQEFKEAVEQTKEGAIYMGVSRGKLSEGIDLGDDFCRAVVIIGLPYPARYDPKVVLKQKYLDENKMKINGMKWYMLQMKRALNQSIGRVIRHKKDYGTIVICDSRFRQLQDGLSRWIQAFLSANNSAQSFNSNFQSTLQNIAKFFVQMQNLNADDFGLPSAQSRLESSQVKSESKCSVLKKLPASNAICANSQNDKLMKSTFDSLKKNYTPHVFPEPATSPEDGGKRKSIFDSISQLQSGKSSKRNFSVSPTIELDYGQDELAMNKKKKSAQTVIQTDLDFENDPSSQYSQELSVIRTTLNSELTLNVDLNLLTAPLRELTSAMKCRQYTETLRVYSKKKSVNYLTQRINFILDGITKDKRDSILKSKYF